MDDTFHLPSDQLPSNETVDFPWRANLTDWVSDVLSMRQAWLRDLPAGRGPHTQLSEQRFAQELGRLHHGVASQLAEGRQRIDLREFGDVLNRMPGVGVTMLHRIVTFRRFGHRAIEWPSEFVAVGRGPSFLFSSFLTDSLSESEDSDSDSDEEPSVSDPTIETDSESDDDRFQALDVEDRRRLCVNWVCDHWHSENERVLKDWHRLNNRQWVQAQQALEQVRLQAVEASFTVRLDVQWPSSMHLSFASHLQRIEKFMSDHQLGPCSIQWQMVDPLVPEHLRSPSAFLEQCQFKESLFSLYQRVRHLEVALMSTFPKRMRSEGLSEDAKAVHRSHLASFMERLDQAVLGLHDGKACVVSLAGAPFCWWHEDLQAALLSWQADPLLAPAASRIEITLADT
jgi:hypothetical protein